MIRLHGLESRPASADRPPIDTYVQTPYNYGMTETTNKASRFEMRLTPSQKERLDRAAEFRGLSTSQWALTNLLVAADRDIRESHVLHLDDEAWDSFVRALDEPMPEEMVRLLESEPIWKMTDFTPPRRLTAEDDADGFDCGLPVVNDWLRNQLRNAGKQHTAVAYATFCDGAPAGFYTLGAYSIGHAEANGWLRRNSPDPIPAILLGMLGVAMRYQTMHVGAQLLRDAAMRAMGAAEIVGAKALLVEPASDRATRFYEHYGFRHIERSGRMFIPLRSA